jgi:curved DNA-binding protein CbpA
MPFKDHFQTLRVSHRATPQQVQKAYYDRLKLFHPDYYQDDPSRRAIAETETKCLNEAYEVLGKPGEREQYITQWERHQIAQRPPERLLALERSLADARSDLSTARLQLSELKSTLDQRDRELEAANLGVHQGYQRVTHLQEAAQSFQEQARHLQDLVLERELELRNARIHTGELEAQLNRLQTEVEQSREDHLRSRQALREQQNRLTEAERELLERKLEMDRLHRDTVTSRDREAYQETVQRLEDAVSRGQALTDKLRGAVVSTEEALRVRQAELDGRTSEVQQLRQSASLGQDRVRDQQALLDKTALELRSLQGKLELAEAELRRNREPVPAGAETAEPADDEIRRQKEQIRALGEALTQRTEEARQAQQQVDSQIERLRSLEATEHNQTGRPPNGGVRHRFVFVVARATSWLSPQRATAIMSGLMLALCAVAVTLVLLTVSIDLPGLASGLGRAISAMAGQAPR